MARRLYEDIRGLKFAGIDGYVEDGSQRSGFPNAFPVYIYAETLMNRGCDFEKVREDYFAHIYGPDWQEALSLLSRMTEVFDFAFLEGAQKDKKAISKGKNRLFDDGSRPGKRGYLRQLSQ